MDTFKYVITISDEDAKALAAAHPDWEVERAYHYDADKAKAQRERAKAKRDANKAELEALRAEKLAAATTK